MSSPLTWVVLLASALTLPLPVLAQSTSEARARLHFDSATAHYETGDYESALREFEAAYAESGRVELQYNIYLCAERLGRFEQAADALERFIEEGAPENEESLRQRLSRLRARIAEDADPAPPPSAPVPTAPSTFDPTLSIVGFSIAAVGVIGFASFGGATLAEDARLRGSCNTSCGPSDTGTIAVTAPLTDVSAGVALAGAVLGVIGLFVGQGSAEAAPTGATVRLEGLGVGGTF